MTIIKHNQKSLTPNNLGKKYLVEQCQKIRIIDFLKTYRHKLKKLVLTSELEILELKINLTTSKTCYNGIRFWFKCPLCYKRIGVLYKHPLNNKLGCRCCLNLEYKKQRYKGMLEAGLA